MKSTVTASLYCLLFIFCCSAATFAQIKTPAASPSQVVKQAFGLGEITIDYSRPVVKGRTIFGDLVPYGKIWRTGANSTSKLTFSTDVTIAGKVLPAGTYGLYTIPNKTSWEVMLTKDLQLGGNVADYKTENEVLRFTVKPMPISYQIESFTIMVSDVAPSKANIEIMWDKTFVSFPVTADVDATVMKSIDSSLASDKPDYFSAATYYYNTGKDAKKALEWVTKATDANPDAFYMFLLKARLQAKLGDKTGAIATAKKTIELSQKAKNADYEKMATQVITDATKKK